MGWVGWFFFSIFAGIGFIAFPIDLIMAFKHRPKKMSAKTYASQKTRLLNRADELLRIGSAFEREIQYLSAKDRKKRTRANKLAPARYSTMLMGLWLLVSAFGNFAAGALGEVYGTITPQAYFAYTTLVLVVAAMVLFVGSKKLTSMMHGVK